VLTLRLIYRHGCCKSNCRQIRQPLKGMPVSVWPVLSLSLHHPLPTLYPSRSRIPRLGSNNLAWVFPFLPSFRISVSPVAPPVIYWSQDTRRRKVTKRENVDMRANTSVDGVLDGHREYHHHRLFTQHLDGPACGHDPCGPLLPERGGGSRFSCLFGDWDKDEDRDSSTYVPVSREFDCPLFLHFLPPCLLFSNSLDSVKLTLSPFPAISIHSSVTAAFNDHHALPLSGMAPGLIPTIHFMPTVALPRVSKYSRLGCCLHDPI